MIIKRNKNKPNNPKNEPPKEVAPQQQQEIQPQELSPFDDALEIKERSERRRGDRRRGYRRVDDRNLISRAQEEANTIKERGAKDGYNQGLAAAQMQIDSLKTAMSELLFAKEEAMNIATKDIAQIALKVAEKIIKMEVTCDETVVLSIIADVLKEVGREESKIIIKTNPLDTDLVKQNLPNLFTYDTNEAKILVFDDNDVEQGSCIVETSNGLIDARFSTQLLIIEKAFQAGI